MNERVMHELREMLGRAERGEIVAIAIATVEPDLTTGSAYTLGDRPLSELLGSISLMQHRIMTAAEKGPLD